MTTTCTTCDSGTGSVPGGAPTRNDPGTGKARAPLDRRLLLAVMLDALTAGAFLPLLFLYLSTTTSLGASDIGLVLSVGGAAGLLLNPLAGTVTDRLGAGPTVLVANLVAAVGFVALLWVGPFAQLVGAIAVVTLGQRLYWSAWPVFMAQQVDGGPTLDRWFATVNAAKSGALGVGSAAAAGLLALAARTASGSSWSQRRQGRSAARCCCGQWCAPAPPAVGMRRPRALFPRRWLAGGPRCCATAATSA